MSPEILGQVNNMSKKNRDWDNWCTSSELSRIWKVSQRRVQQLLVEINAQGLLEIGVLVVDIGGTNPVSMPIYRRVGK